MDGLLATVERQRFIPPVVRTGVRRAAPPQTCRAAHLAPARAMDPDAGPDRRTRPLVATLQGPQAVDLLLDRVTVLTTEGRGAAAPMLSRGVSAFQRERTLR
jgi:hypothetical protein